MRTLIVALVTTLSMAALVAQTPEPNRPDTILKAAPASEQVKFSPFQIAADGKSLSVSKAATAEKICFEGDCLTATDLRALVAGRQASLSSVVQAQQSAAVLRQAFTAAENKLGDCEEAIGPMRKLRTAVVNGELVDWGTVKQLIDAANPGKLFDVQTKVLKGK